MALLIKFPDLYPLRKHSICVESNRRCVTDVEKHPQQAAIRGNLCTGNIINVQL